MQLSDDQVQYLFLFTEKKSVRWYDLQVELVDHLASRIEEVMTTDTSLSFESALQKVYKGFGIAGFSRVIQEKQIQLERSAQKRWWREIRIAFTWPKIVLLALVFGLCWQLALRFDPTLLMRIFGVGYILVSIIMIFYLFKRTRRKLLFLETGSRYYPWMVAVFEWFIVFRDHGFSNIEFCSYATIGVLIKVVSFQLYNKVNKEAKKLYPEALA